MKKVTNRNHPNPCKECINSPGWSVAITLGKEIVHIRSTLKGLNLSRNPLCNALAKADLRFGVEPGMDQLLTPTIYRS